MDYTFKQFLQKCEEGTHHHHNWGGDRSTHRSAITRMIPKTIDMKPGSETPKSMFKNAKKALFKF
jgi:hypothetical protein